MSKALLSMSLIATVAIGGLIGISVLQDAGGVRSVRPFDRERQGEAGVSAPRQSGEAPLQVRGTFTIRHTGGGTNCVVDGDTVWIAGTKTRIADIDAPETHPPCCDLEADLGEKATVRLAELMNAGPFEQRVADRDVDRYGRRLRVLVRDGRSLGDRLVEEGLARTWEGRRRPWC